MSPHFCWLVRFPDIPMVCRVLSLLKHVQFLISFTVQTPYHGLWKSACLGRYLSGLLSAFSLLLSSNTALQFKPTFVSAFAFASAWLPLYLLPVTPQVCIQASRTLDGHSDPLPKVLPFLISATVISVCRQPCGCPICSIFTGPPFSIECCAHKVT